MQVVRPWDEGDVPELLDLERLDRDLFRNRLNQVNMNDTLFGGQVLAQALAAASRTIGPVGADGSAARPVHSLHGYFLRAGQVWLPVLYQVERTRDGGRFSTRRVVAFQEGEPIFHMECGFHAGEEGFAHQQPLPATIPRPDQLKPLLQLVADLGDRAAPWLRRWDGRRPWPVDVRPVDPVGFFRSADERPQRAIWMRVPGAAGSPLAVQAAILAWMSDYWLAGTAALPYTSLDRPLFLASLDHAMWFHRPADTAEWLLFEIESPSAQCGRGLSRALIHAEDGRLVASVAQEALLRQRRG